MDFNVKLWRQYRKDHPEIRKILNRDISYTYLYIQNVYYRNAQQLSVFLRSLQFHMVRRDIYRDIYQYLWENIRLTVDLVAYIIAQGLYWLTTELFKQKGQHLLIYADSIETHDIIHLIITIFETNDPKFKLSSRVDDVGRPLNLNIVLMILKKAGANFDGLYQGLYPYDRLKQLHMCDITEFRPSWNFKTHLYNRDDIQLCEFVMTVVICLRYHSLMPIEIIEIILGYTLGC